MARLLQGIVGVTGIAGSTGISGGTGIQGAVGSQGATGAGIQGITGLIGTTGIQGTVGAQGATGAGIQGVTGIVGINGSQGVTGIRGVTGIAGINGSQGVTGLGLTGIQGATGISGSGSSVLFDNTSRYSASTTTDQECYILSASTVWSGLSWSRSTTTLTITRNSHGHASGDRVIIRNTNEGYLNTVITSTATDTFTVTCNDTGAASGTAGAYSLGFKVSYGTNTLTISAPSGLESSGVQLISIRFRGTSSSGGNFDLTVPSGINNGVGGESSRNDVNVPVYRVSGDTDTLTVVGATIAVNNSSAGYNVYRFAGAGTSLVRLFSLNF